MNYLDIAHKTDNYIIWYVKNNEVIFDLEASDHGDVYDEIDVDCYIYGRIDIDEKIGSISGYHPSEWRDIKEFKKIIDELVSRCPDVKFYVFLQDDQGISIPVFYKQLEGYGCSSTT